MLGPTTVLREQDFKQKLCQSQNQILTLCCMLMRFIRNSAAPFVKYENSGFLGQLISLSTHLSIKRRFIQFFPRHKIYFQVRLLLKSKDLNLLIRLPWKILSSVSFAPSLGQFLVGATERWNKVSNFSRCDTSYFFYSYSHCSQTSHTRYYHLLLLLSTLFNVQMFTSLCLALYNVQCSSHGWLQVRKDREQEMLRAFQINFC